MFFLRLRAKKGFFASDLSFVSPGTCNQDRTCFVGHTDKCFHKCSVDHFSRPDWPLLIYYACGIQDTLRNCLA